MRGNPPCSLQLQFLHTAVPAVTAQACRRVCKQSYLWSYTMATTVFDVACPSCDRQLKAKPDLIGKRVKCPACQNMLTVKPPDAGADDTGFDPDNPFGDTNRTNSRVMHETRIKPCHARASPTSGSRPNAGTAPSTGNSSRSVRTRRKPLKSSTN